MNFVQRAMLYMSRKKGKTISLFLMIFVVAVFLISCFGVLNATKSLSRDIRTSVGAALYIRATTEMIMDEGGETKTKENQIRITQAEIDEIKQTGKIKYDNPINYGFAKSDSLQFIQGINHTDGSNMGKVTGLRFSALASDFVDETVTLVEGKHISDADKGKILISEALASANQLSVGDKLTLTHAKLGEANGIYIDEIPVKTAYAQVEVCGIYKLNVPEALLQPTAGVADNRIYASLDVLDDLQESEPGVYTGEVGFYITDPEELEGVTHNVQRLESIEWTTHFIRTNDFQYAKIGDQLSSLGNLMKILIVLASVVSAAVLTLLLSMRMCSRIHEAGVLLAAGISKKQVMAGFLLEVLLVATTALMLSYIASLGVSNIMGCVLFGELQPTLLNDETLTVGMNTGIQIENYLKPNGITVLLIYLCEALAISASTFLSSIMILRLKPKDILSKMS